MPKALHEKSLKISDKPKSRGAMTSYVEGSKPSKSPKPKSLSPDPRFK